MQLTEANLKELASNINYFHNLILPIINPELTDVDIIQVPDFHWELYDTLQKEERFQLLVAPVGFAKSTILKVFAIYELLVKNSENYTLYVSSTDTKAVEHLGFIQKILKQDFMQAIFGYSIVSKNTHEITIRIGKTEYKLEAVGSGADIAGKNFNGIRPGLIIIDDLEDLEQANSKDRTNKLEDWLFTVLIARLPSLSSGRVRMINTVLSLDALTNRILGKAPGVDKSAYSDWNTYFYQALDDNNKSIWEDRHPTDNLLEERKLRPHTFARNYMNEPIDSSNSLVKYDDIRYFDYIDLDEFTNLYMHADTTHTGKTTSDYFAIGIMGESKKDKNYYLLDFVMDKIDVEAQARKTILLYQKYQSKVARLTYDEKANQGFGFWVKKLAKEEYNVSIPISPLNYAKDKVTHFEPHQPHFKANRVYLPLKNAKSSMLADQLAAFPSKNINDDGVDMMSGLLDNFTQDRAVFRGITFD